MKLSKLHEEETTSKGVTIVKSPHRPGKSVYNRPKKIFLAGSIDMGKAVDWQTSLTKALQESNINDIVIFNPRRDDWDSSWEQSIENEKFNEQVTWEMDHLDRADLIAVYFDPKGQAPITLLELGLHAADDKMVVCCPDGYWRKGNVEMVCDRYSIPLVDSLDDLIDAVKDELDKL